MNNQETCLSENILLHIGYHKTATTWFQSELFSRAEFGFQPLSSRNIVHHALCRPNPFFNRPNQPIQQLLAEAHEATSAGKVFVLSHERLSGYPASGGFDSKLIAERLKLHFPNARVLCLFREQTAMILSAWRQQIVDGGGTSLRRFLDSPEPNIKRIPLFDPEMYKYTHLLKYYSRLFRATSTLFIPYEEFCIRPHDVIMKIARLVRNEKLEHEALRLTANLNIRNPSLSSLTLGVQRLLNVLFARTQLSQSCLVNVGAPNIRAAMRRADKVLTRCVPSAIEQYFHDRAVAKINSYCGTLFHEDNAALSELLGVHLSEYGYGMDRRAI